MEPTLRQDSAKRYDTHVRSSGVKILPITWSKTLPADRPSTLTNLARILWQYHSECDLQRTRSNWWRHFGGNVKMNRELLWGKFGSCKLKRFAINLTFVPAGDFGNVRRHLEGDGDTTEGICNIARTVQPISMNAFIIYKAEISCDKPLVKPEVVCFSADVKIWPPKPEAPRNSRTTAGD